MKLSNQAKNVLDTLKSEDWSYQQVAEKMDIDAEKFDHLMSERFDTEENDKEGKTFHLTYTLEWAERVKQNPFPSADKETTSVLKEAGYSQTA
jgi:gamma-glutamylcysteine synthetase